MNNNSQIQNKFHLIYLIGFCLISALPFLTFPPWFIPVEWGKIIVFRIILSVLLFLFIYQLLSKKRGLNISRSLAFWFLIALGGIFLLATVFSLEPHFSFWGSPYRAGGSLNFLFLVILALLAFYIFSAKDWRKIWNIAFFAGILVCLIAIFQKFEMFKGFLIPSAWQPYSTLGGPTFFALYVLLLTFLPLSFGIEEKTKKRFFYFFAFALFILGIVLTASRASVLGFFIGFLFFVFFYPKKIFWLKISLGLILILTIFGSFWLNGNPTLIQKLKENNILGTAFNRLFPPVQSFLNIKNFSINKVVDLNRLSAWKMSLQALKERPILGYGPENFSIAFDKYYNSNLPGFGDEGADWWDRAHNFIFDISVTAGIPALIIYLLLFAVLFWQLQKIKQKKPVAHSIQATFIAYLVANLFGFDVFSTYLIAFLLISYSLFLIKENGPPQQEPVKVKDNQPKPLWKSAIIFGLFCILIWFIWSGNLKPLKVNKELNWADYYLTKQDCSRALEKIEEVLPQKTVIDDYVALKYVNVIQQCSRQKPELKLALSKKAIEILKEAIKVRPYYTRSWVFLGGFYNALIKSDPNLTPQQLEDFKKQANFAFEKAHQLRPKYQFVLKELVKSNLLLGNFQKAKEEAEECLTIRENFGECWWLLGLTNLYLNKEQEAEESFSKAKENKYPADSELEDALLQLTEPYVLNKNYQKLIEIYQQIIKIKPNNAQYHASLAVCYKETSDFKKAEQEAILVLQLTPEAKAEVEEFLKTLR